MDRPRLKKTGIILQARMGSTRLPGKVIKPMAGKPMIHWCIERLKAVRGSSELIVATSDRPEEQPLIDVLSSLAVPVFRGSELDVLDRYYQCARTYNLTSIVRATGDNPLVSTKYCDDLIDLFHRENLDYACSFPEFGSGLPIGVGLEIFSFKALARSWSEGLKSNHREHVNEYIQENLQDFKWSVLKPASSLYPAEHLRLTVDTPEDFSRVEQVFLDLKNP